MNDTNDSDPEVRERAAVASRADVDPVLARAETAGATLLAKPHDRPSGIYSGYFHDPDGHLWEVMHNPALDLDAG